MTKKRNGNDKSYDVGYKKPPVETRWKPGQSGNQKGRKKGSRNLLSIAQEVFNEPVVLKENGKSRTVPYAEALIRLISKRAANGEKHSLSLSFKLIEQYEASEKHLAAQQAKLNYRIIDSTMTAKEAADAYAETLTAIGGIPGGGTTDWEVE